ncbi:peptidyl-prolyl cis-trans isomerase FKBP16-1, chloroplastic isoform X2 [Camellia sinensis]|uniref:peptidyl-prolyl cis-trans isomerase FKBP16-1, chloroplastic isoform X2 n=1 Tax=Camellia sinensis TaxID=4442 RepID=UPI001035ABC8|nr:peptidyl-prolyl cis-trans isomerase FKBP16-1, chloroplastic isoform X2 [Camellia sinensis]
MVLIHPRRGPVRSSTSPPYPNPLLPATFLCFSIPGSSFEQMEVPTFHTPFQLSNAFKSPSFMNNEQSKIALLRNLGHRLPALIVKKVPRRPLLQFVVFNPIFLNVYPVLGAPNPEMKEPEVIRTQKLASGVRIQDIIEGEGPEAHEGSLVEVNYVCRRSNGYFVHSTIDQFSGESSPVILPLDENQCYHSVTQIIKGLKEVLVGMKVGGKRRALIPPSAGYTNENLQPIPDEFGPRRSLFSHANEPLVFEVQLLKVL